MIKTINVAQLLNYELAISDDGRFFAVATKLTDIKIWEIKQKRGTTEVDYIDVAMTLKGHRRGVHSLAFTPLSTSLISAPLSIVTASIDGSLRMWNLHVRYQQGEDPKTVWNIDTGLKQLDLVRIRPLISMSSNSNVTAAIGQLCVNSGNTLRFYATDKGHLLEEISNAHKNHVKGMEYRRDGQRLATYAENTKTITIWDVKKVSST